MSVLKCNQMAARLLHQAWFCFWHVKFVFCFFCCFFLFLGLEVFWITWNSDELSVPLGMRTYKQFQSIFINPKWAISPKPHQKNRPVLAGLWCLCFHSIPSKNPVLWDATISNFCSLRVGYFWQADVFDLLCCVVTYEALQSGLFRLFLLLSLFSQEKKRHI